MLKLLNTKTQLYSAAMITGAMISSSANATGTFNDYTRDLSNQVTGFPDVVGYLCYLGGFALAALGVVNLKQHVENPGNKPMKDGLAKLGFGGMLMALPPVVGAIQGSAMSSDGVQQGLQQFGTQGIQ